MRIGVIKVSTTKPIEEPIKPKKEPTAANPFPTAWKNEPMSVIAMEFEAKDMNCIPVFLNPSAACFKSSAAACGTEENLSKRTCQLGRKETACPLICPAEYR